MTNETAPRGPGSGEDQEHPEPAAGRGRLAQVLETRGGTAAPEAPFVIEHREALIYMLCEAAELEHAIMCQYLFAAFSLKQSADEGLTETELAAVRRWRRQISHVATQEMLHLALVHNLLSAVGAAPHMARPNLPQPANHYPAGVQLALLPFGEPALRHFMFLERPEGMALEDAEGLAAMGEAVPVMNKRDIVPRGQDFATVGHLYRSIETGLVHLAEKYGQDWLFVGPHNAQATETHFGWPELAPVTDSASAQRAVDTILEQGEGPRGHWRNAHFGQFVNILDEYLELREANPAFDPVRPVVAANVRPHERGIDVPLISDLLTARVTDLFNVSYEILLQMFERFFAHTEETEAELKTLADATIALMLRVIKPLGDLITTLPVGPDQPGKTAGPSFELFYESDYLMPHQEAAWALLTERLGDAARFCNEICIGRGTAIADRLAPVLAGIKEIITMFAAHLPEGSPHTRIAAQLTQPEPVTLGTLRHRAGELAAAVAGGRRDSAATRGAGEIFDAAYAVVTGSGSRSEAKSPSPAAVAARLVDSVLRPLADLLADPAGGTGSTATTGSAATAGTTATTGGDTDGASGPASPGGPSAAVADRLWELTKAATSLRARLAREHAAPPELAEAAAALQDLACRLAPETERERRVAELWDLQAGLPTMIQAAHDGPYLVTNMPRLVSHLGEQTRPAPQLALCRCGESSIKPFCDGSHARTGFTGAKDPKRVPDRLDRYRGQQVTVLDNRGTCQHSGFCTDRLPTAFRTGKEPFVAPSGGRMDEIIRAVRDCPSGALSYALDDTEARKHVDWGNSRTPSIEVTKDGPYRITGGIPVTDADGRPVARNAGASLEHAALCRCGHSQNKPFCSGMHWYVEFRDPVPAPGHRPTLFEWAGGLPALTRMTRLFYEKHVPADPVLAPLFAEMPADQAQRLADWLAEVLGGPAVYSGRRGGFQQMAAAHAGRGFTEEQRARWAELLVVAAAGAGLPADAEFRSALVSCIEWWTRAAVAQSQSAAAEPAAAPMPRWDWGPAGPPAVPSPSEPELQEAEPAPMPAPGQPVSFASHIRPLFRSRDRQSMSFAFDLWSCDDVRTHATDIQQRLRDGSMPCDGAWPKERIEVFSRWTESGMQP